MWSLQSLFSTRPCFVDSMCIFFNNFINNLCYSISSEYFLMYAQISAAGIHVKLGIKSPLRSIFLQNAYPINGLLSNWSIKWCQPISRILSNFSAVDYCVIFVYSVFILDAKLMMNVCVFLRRLLALNIYWDSCSPRNQVEHLYDLLLMMLANDRFIAPFRGSGSPNYTWATSE